MEDIYPPPTFMTEIRHDDTELDSTEKVEVPQTERNISVRAFTRSRLLELSFSSSLNIPPSTYTFTFKKIQPLQ